MQKEVLKSAGVKLTKPRLKILGVFGKKHRGFCAKEIYENIGGVVDLSSIYRTLELFCDLGILYEENFGDAKTYYLADDKHHHIVCRECGYRECVPCRHDFRVRNFREISHQMSLSGVCNKCLIQ
ncbi:transcriptional repressor [Patescibacteria group bacterium]|nr:transcriptional repressor [Patescibacteria group bacterium]